MNKITCLADILAYVPRVRVIKTTTSFVDDGYESEIDSINYEVKSVSIRNKSGLRSTFNFANVQFLTPVQYEGRYIGLGDKINGSEVFDYCWHDDKWNVRYAIGGDYTNIDILSELQVNRLRTFQPLHKLTPKIELSTEEMIEELRRRGIDFADLY